MATAKANAKTRILTFLRSGKSITTEAARSRFRIENVSARINDLRNDGYLIYCTPRKYRGETRYSYRLAEWQQAGYYGKSF